MNKQNNQEVMNNEVVILNNRQIKARFWKRHIANILEKTFNIGNATALNIAESINLVSINQDNDFTWAGQPAPHTEVTAEILSGDTPVVKSFRFYQAGPRANRMVTPSKKDRPVAVESIDSFILDLVTDNVFQPIAH